MNMKAEEISPLGKYEEGMPWNSVEKVILERRSIRSFDFAVPPRSPRLRVRPDPFEHLCLCVFW